MTQYVKITSKGKVSVQLTQGMKYTFKNLLELMMNDKPRKPLDLASSADLVNIALVDEIYRKYHTQLCFLQGDTKLLLTLAQAYALWTLCQQYDRYAFDNVGLGGVLLQLHQKLS